MTNRIFDGINIHRWPCTPTMSVNIKVQGCPMFPVYECVFCPYNDDIEIVYESGLALQRRIWYEKL